MPWSCLRQGTFTTTKLTHVSCLHNSKHICKMVHAPPAGSKYLQWMNRDGSTQIKSTITAMNVTVEMPHLPHISRMLWICPSGTSFTRECMCRCEISDKHLHNPLAGMQLIPYILETVTADHLETWQMPPTLLQQHLPSSVFAITRSFAKISNALVAIVVVTAVV